MVTTSDGIDWDLLIDRIKDGKCTPFLGAGACAGVLPLGGKIAEELSDEFNFPIKDSRHDLARVSQYIAVYKDNLTPKQKVVERLSGVAPPNFGPDSNELHAVLADLTLPIYITTNYDDFMYQALIKKNRNARQVLCLWKDTLKLNYKKAWGWDLNYVPTPEKPVVFHLHGHLQVPESLVLTEDDYLDFLINIKQNRTLIPERIQEAISGASVLFLGYSLADTNFRVLFRSLAYYLGRNQVKHMSVQLVPGEQGLEQEELERVREYLKKYFNDQNIQVFWGTCEKFAQNLRQKMEERRHGG